MKIIISIITAISLLLAYSYTRREIATHAIDDVQEKTNQAALEIQENAIKQQEKQEHDKWAATKTKLYVRARDTKTCMRILKIKVINNEVAECNQDHYVELRNDEIEKFKKENEL